MTTSGTLRSAGWLARVMGASGLAALGIGGVILAISVQQVSRGGTPTVLGVLAALVCTLLAAAHFFAAAELANGSGRGPRVAAGLAGLELLALAGATLASLPIGNDEAAMAAVLGATLMVELVVAVRLVRARGS